VLYIKALHIIFIVTWFAGLFYIVRLFIYHREAADKPEPEKGILMAQLGIMMRRLWYGITWPSAVLTFIFGFWLLWYLRYEHFLWMQVKLGFVLLLLLYQLWLQRIYNRQMAGIFPFSSTALRLINELATLLLIAIVFLIVGKNEIDYLSGALWLIGLLVLFVVIIQLYKKRRLKDK
jgi:putative membrane protein